MNTAYKIIVEYGIHTRTINLTGNGLSIEKVQEIFSRGKKPLMITFTSGIARVIF